MKHRITISFNFIGLLLMCIYIFMSFNALDILIPSSINSLCLFSFIAFGVFVTLKNARHFSLTLYSRWYMIFMVASLIITIYSPERNILGGEFYLMIVSFVLTYVFQLFIVDAKSFRIMGWAYAVSSCVLVVSLYFTGNLTASASNRLGGDLMGNANTFAGMLMVAVLYEMWLLVYDIKKNVIKLCVLSMLLLNMYALILSAGRKFFVIPFLFLYILLLYKQDLHGRKHIIKYTVLIVCIVIVVYFLLMNVPLFYQNIGYRIESYINGVRGIDKQGASAALREEMRKLALAQWKVSPIWGYGFDSFKYCAQKVLGYFFYSHCNYTELLYNGGILYFIVYYSFFFVVLKKVFIDKIGKRKYRAFAGALVMSLLIFDYGAVSYSMAITQTMLSVAMRLLFKNNGELQNE